MAVLMSVTALSVDAMIPALGLMATDLNVQNTNDIQMVIISVFFGMSFGIMFYGPFADSFYSWQQIIIFVSIASMAL